MVFAQAMCMPWLQGYHFSRNKRALLPEALGGPCSSPAKLLVRERRWACRERSTCKGKAAPKSSTRAHTHPHAGRGDLH